MKNIFGWVEIPATDFQRAKIFYETILDIQIQEMDFQNFKMGFFPDYNKDIVSGAIVHGEGYKPSTDGLLVYINCNPDLQDVLDRVEKAGGQVTQPKTQISPEYGYMALIIDTEGNRLGIHSQN